MGAYGSYAAVDQRFSPGDSIVPWDSWWYLETILVIIIGGGCGRCS